ERFEFEYRVTIREQVQGASGLFESRPEHRRGDEQDDEYDHALPLDTVEAGEEQKVSEVKYRHRGYQVGGLPRDRQRIQFDHATDSQYADHGDDRKACSDRKPALAPHGSVRFRIPR